MGPISGRLPWKPVHSLRRRCSARKRLAEAPRFSAAPRSATSGDLDRLASVGFTNAQVLRLTLVVSLRIAFATVNGALGAHPEQQYLDLVDPGARDAWESAFSP